MSVRPAYAPPPAPVYSWTGMYWGANVGYSWGKSKYDATLTGVGTNVLFYGTGGAAYGLVKNSATITVAGLSAVASSSDLRAGWTAGGGVEGALGGGWSAKLEYLYMDLGRTERTFSGLGLGTIATETRETTDNIVRVGLNYKWGGY